MDYTKTDMTRQDVDSLPGPTVLEFGVNWCGHCARAQPAIESAIELAMGRYPDIRHLKIEDGKGRRLGRSFRVKLWPTLVFLADGKEVRRIVRPTEAGAIVEALDEIHDAR